MHKKRSREEISGTFFAGDEIVGDDASCVVFEILYAETFLRFPRRETRRPHDFATFSREERFRELFCFFGPFDTAEEACQLGIDKMPTRARERAGVGIDVPGLRHFQFMASSVCGVYEHGCRVAAEYARNSDHANGVFFGFRLVCFFCHGWIRVFRV